MVGGDPQATDKPWCGNPQMTNKVAEVGPKVVNKSLEGEPQATAEPELMGLQAPP